MHGIGCFECQPGLTFQYKKKLDKMDPDPVKPYSVSLSTMSLDKALLGRT